MSTIVYNDVFAGRLTAARKKRGMKQDELAKEAGISRQSLSKYENGERLPAVDVLHNIAVALNISADYLIGTTDREIGPYLTGISEEAHLEWEIALINQKQFKRELVNNTHDRLRNLNNGSVGKVALINAILEHSDLWEEMGAAVYSYARYMKQKALTSAYDVDRDPETLASVNVEKAKVRLHELIEKTNWRFQDDGNEK